MLVNFLVIFTPKKRDFRAQGQALGPAWGPFLALFWGPKKGDQTLRGGPEGGREKIKIKKNYFPPRGDIKRDASSLFRHSARYRSFFRGSRLDQPPSWCGVVRGLRGDPCPDPLPLKHVHARAFPELTGGTSSSFFRVRPLRNPHITLPDHQKKLQPVCGAMMANLVVWDGYATVPFRPISHPDFRFDRPP